MQSYCAAGWPEVCLHHPPDACGHVLLVTDICVDKENTNKARVNSPGEVHELELQLSRYLKNDLKINMLNKTSAMLNLSIIS